MKWMICEGGVSAMKWMISTMKWKFTMYSAICESWSGIIRMAMRLQLAPYDLFQAMMRLYRYIDGLKFSSDYPLDHAIVAIFMMYDEHAMDATVDNFFQVLYHVRFAFCLRRLLTIGQIVRRRRRQNAKRTERTQRDA